MFKGIGGLGNLTSIIGSLQQLPDKLKALNERMKSETVSASSGCGRVQITMSGTAHVQHVEIDQSLTGHDLEIAVQEATNAAGAAAKQLYTEAIHQLISELDLNVPGLEGLLTKLIGGN